ncbi:MAG: SGNH/GDSL hydrolase family protein [Clostridia bacterium]|nr:SGNH/GDSL hydrolase family protein [Clostridia bacterium]
MYNPVPAEVDGNMIVPTSLDAKNLVFCDVRRPPFSVHGLWKPTEEAVFRRLPTDVAAAVSSKVKVLARQTAGGRVRFSTDSRTVAIKAVMPYVKQMDHMPLSSTSGFDLYLDTDADSHYVHTFRIPTSATDGYESMVRFPDRRMRSFTLNFPSYNAVDALYIGLQADASLAEGRAYRDLAPVYYYGSSITQGACSSRPGLAYQNIISRRLNLDFVNLGFSGSAKAEPAICRFMAEQEMSVFVSDYDHNAPTVDHLADTHYALYETIRAAHPDIPYIMLSRPDFDRNYADSVARRAVVQATYDRARAAGDERVYFIDGQSIFRGPWEDSCTVDGTHPNDIGFMLMADHIGRAIERFLR